MRYFTQGLGEGILGPCLLQQWNFHLLMIALLYWIWWPKNYERQSSPDRQLAYV